MSLDQSDPTIKSHNLETIRYCVSSVRFQLDYVLEWYQF